VKKTKELAKPTTSRPRSPGTAVLGRVIPELAICGAFNVTDDEVKGIARSISVALLGQFQMDVLQASGLLGNADEEL
jgi:hypothetical protein